MKHIKSIISISLLIFIFLGCGSSGGGNTPQSDTQTETLSGVAATGAAIANAAIYLKDSNDVARSDVTDNNGNYSFDVAGLTPPFYIFVDMNSDGLATSDDIFSISTGSGTGNINPITNLIVAAAGGVSNPADVYKYPDTFQLDIDQAVEEVMNFLSPVLDKYETGVDPLSGAFVADNTGLDAFFDDVNIDILDTGVVTFTDGFNNVLGQIDNIGNVSASDPLPPLLHPIYITVSGNGLTSSGVLLTIWSEIDEQTGSGAIDFYDPLARKGLISTSITTVIATDGVVTISGNGSVNGVPGHSFFAKIKESVPDEIGMELRNPDGSVVYSLNLDPIVGSSGGYTVSTTTVSAL